jgi:hypothetical protein
MKTYMVKQVFWKISKKKLNRHISKREKKEVLKSPHFEIADICGGFGQILSFLLLKRVYEGRVNPNPLTPKEDDWTDGHPTTVLKSPHLEEEKNKF